MKHEINTDDAAGAAPSTAAPGFTSIFTVILQDAAAIPAAASVLFSCFIFISKCQFLMFDLNDDSWYVPTPKRVPDRFQTDSRSIRDGFGQLGSRQVRDVSKFPK